MVNLTSLSNRLMMGYILAGSFFLAFLAIAEQFTSDSPMQRILFAVLVIALFFLFLHLFFFRYFLRPISNLIQVTKELASSNDSHVRAKKYYDDELGELVEAFNDMLDQIQLREEIIISERDRVALALDQADEYARQVQASNQKLELEVKVRHSIETKLTEFQKFLQSIFNSMPSALIAIDENLTVTHWNKEAEALSKVSSLQAVGQNILDMLSLLSGQADWIRQVWQTNQPRKLHSLEWHNGHEHRLIDIVAYPLFNTESPSAVVRIDDVTEKLRLEEAIVQSDKVMSLGGMAAGMAHEINNPISAIIQNVQNIQRRIDPELAANQLKAAEANIDLQHLNAYLKERKILSFLNNISQSGLRASNLVKNMLQFSRANDLSLQPCLVIEVLEKAINIALTDEQLSTFNEDFALNFDQDFQAPGAQVMGVFTELEQVILNLIKNSAYAIRDRKLTLNDIDDGIINIQQKMIDGHCVIRVSDNGCGMSAKTRKKIFEPFFTTKDVGVGTGLGLSVSYFIITSHHHGEMRVESELGVGSTFEIKLPLKEDKTIG